MCPAQGWHAVTRVRVEARAALEQAEELRRVLEGGTAWDAREHAF